MRMNTVDVEAEVECIRKLIGMRCFNVYDITPRKSIDRTYRFCLIKYLDSFLCPLNKQGDCWKKWKRLSGGYRGMILAPSRPYVQKALHANVTKIPYKWVACSEVLNRNWNDSEVSILPIYRKLIKAGVKVWVFSWDVDSGVPASKFALGQLKLENQSPMVSLVCQKTGGRLDRSVRGTYICNSERCRA